MKKRLRARILSAVLVLALSMVLLPITAAAGSTTVTRQWSVNETFTVSFIYTCGEQDEPVDLNVKARYQILEVVDSGGHYHFSIIDNWSGSGTGALGTKFVTSEAALYLDNHTLTDSGASVFHLTQNLRIIPLGPKAASKGFVQWVGSVVVNSNGITVVDSYHTTTECV